MYLEKIQKILKIVETVLRITTVMSFVSGGILFVCGVLGLGGSEEIVTAVGGINIITPVIRADPSKALTAEGAALTVRGISLILGGVVSLFAVRYLARERADGTPFTESGAESVKKLGIISIVISVAASFIQGIVFGALDVTVPMDMSSDAGVTAGLLLLFFSLILHCGVQLRDGKAE